MWLDRIIEEKQSKGITTKMMSERTRSHIPAETINRILTRKTQTPRIDTVLELGESVGLSASELLAETTAVISDSNTAALQAEAEAFRAESEALRTEIDCLRSEHDRLATENGILREKAEALRDKVDTLKDEIIATHRYYISQGKENALQKM